MSRASNIGCFLLAKKYIAKFNPLALDILVSSLIWDIFDKSSLNAVSCQTADNTESVSTSIESDSKDLKII